MFPMLHPNSVRQRFLQPRLFMVYIKKKQQTMITLTGGVLFETETRCEENVFVQPPDQLKDRSLVPTARHSCSLGTV